MKRKNCSISVFTPARPHRGIVRQQPGRPPARHRPQPQLPGFWGGGAPAPLVQRHLPRRRPRRRLRRVDAVRTLISSARSRDLISNHTYSNLVLRPPSLPPTGLAPDEPRATRPSVRSSRRPTTTSTGPRTSSTTPPARRGLELLDHRRLRLHLRDRYGRASTRPTRMRWSAEYLGLDPPRRRARAATGRRTTGWPTQAPARLAPTTRVIGRAPPRPGARSPCPSPLRADDLTGPAAPTARPVTRSPYDNELADLEYTPPVASSSWTVNPSTRSAVIGRYGRDPLAPPQAPTHPDQPGGRPGRGAS